MEIRNAVTSLGALAQETRLAIFRLLVQSGPEGLSAGKIGETLGVAPATLSFHLRELRHAGLTDSRRDSKQIIYSANYETMSELIAYLSENCFRDSEPTSAPTSANLVIGKAVSVNSPCNVE